MLCEHSLQLTPCLVLEAWTLRAGSGGAAGSGEEAALPSLDRRAPRGGAAQPPGHAPPRPPGPRGAGRSLRQGPGEGLPHAATHTAALLRPATKSFDREASGRSPATLPHQLSDTDHRHRSRAHFSSTSCIDFQPPGRGELLSSLALRPQPAPGICLHFGADEMREVLSAYYVPGPRVPCRTSPSLRPSEPSWELLQPRTWRPDTGPRAV